MAGFGFPCGVAPGFDPSHIAAPMTRFSGIPASGGFINLLTGGSPSNSDGTPNPLAAIKYFGPAVEYTGTARTTFTGFPSSTDSNYTIAAFVYFSSLSTTQTIFCSAIVGLQVTSAGLLFIGQFGVGNINSTITLQAGAPYFVVASRSSIAPVTNFVAVRLDTGQIFTSTNATAGALSGTSTSYFPGNRNAVSPCGGGVGPCMYSASALSLQALLTWSSDPWSFWYKTK